jgi:hypothetical protein
MNEISRFSFVVPSLAALISPPSLHKAFLPQCASCRVDSESWCHLTHHQPLDLIETFSIRSGSIARQKHIVRLRAA